MVIIFFHRGDNFFHRGEKLLFGLIAVAMRLLGVIKKGVGAASLCVSDFSTRKKIIFYAKKNYFLREEKLLFALIAVAMRLFRTIIKEVIEVKAGDNFVFFHYIGYAGGVVGLVLRFVSKTLMLAQKIKSLDHRTAQLISLSLTAIKKVRF